MKERLLITGGTGFVAYHLIAEAIEQGLEVHISTRNAAAAHLKNFEISYTSLNFADVAALKYALEQKQYHYIIHAAGATRASSQEQYNLVNAEYTANLARAANVADIPLKKFVFVSSLAAVGPVDTGIIDEHTSLNPVTSYGKSKKLAEELLSGFDELPLLVFRPTAVYGPREKDILIVLKTISRGLELYIGNKPQVLSFVYVKDLAQLITGSLRMEITGKTYNVSDGELYDRFAMAGITKEVFNKKALRFHLPLWLVKQLAAMLEAAGSVSGNVPVLNKEKIAELTASWPCSIEAAKRDLHFKPAYNLQKGLQETLDWYKDNKWL